MSTIKIPKHLNRFVTFCKDGDEIPNELSSFVPQKPDLKGFPYPLPSAKSEYTCFANQGDIVWYGATTGLTRYDKNAKRDADRIMYFSADRYLYDNNVLAIFVDGDKVWVKTETGVVCIEMIPMTAEEKAHYMTEETVKYVTRHGMISHKYLREARNLDSKLPYGECDNDGGFTAGHAIGEIYKYAYYRSEYGDNDPRTVKAKKLATDSVEVALLCMNITGRGNGFAARTFLTRDEPVPDGYFFKKQGDKAYCIASPATLRRGIAGMVIDASTPVPDRLARHYRDEGYCDDDIIYKGDTSSDEITLHYMMMLNAYDFLVDDDDELRQIIVDTTQKLTEHIVDNEYRLIECDGKATLWAKWHEEYFTTPDGWADACLNSAELLMYLKVAEHITGDERWIKEYDYLINERHYDDYMLLHKDRFYHASYVLGCDPCEEMMYGDNMLAIMSYWGLLRLEKDEARREKFIKGLRTWDHTLLRETTPGYLFPLKSVYEDMPIDKEATIDWFIRFNPSRLASGVTYDRADVPIQPMVNGYKLTGWLLNQEERFIAKYDRDPLRFTKGESDTRKVEGSYVYTMGYWIGKFYGIIDDEE